MKEKRFEKNNCRRWRLLLTRVLVLCMLLPCMHVQTFAATQTLKNGYYMIQSGNSSSKVLDINNWNINNGGNLEIYQKNQTTNQIYYIQYVKTAWNWKWMRYTQYYSIRCLHSGKYLHTSDQRYTNANVHQWDGRNTDNALWGIMSAGNGFYFFMNKASGACLDNSGGKAVNGNNVITYSWNRSNAQRWKPISVKKPNFGGNIDNYVAMGGNYSTSNTKTVSGDVRVNYPVTRLQIAIFNTSGKYIRGDISKPNLLNFSYKYTFNFSGLSDGRYYFKVIMWNAWGDITYTGANEFNIANSIPVNKKITVYKQTDKRWKAYPYGYSSSENRRRGIRAYLGQDNSKGTGYGGGCGVLSIVNAVYYLKGTFIQPKWLADFSVNTKARYDGGTYGWLAERLCTEKGGDFGIKFVTDVANINDARAYLKRGNVAIVHVQGHFMALVNYDSKTNKYLVIDSCPSKNRGTSAGYRWMKESEFTGRMALSWTNEKKGRIHIISKR